MSRITGHANAGLLASKIGMSVGARRCRDVGRGSRVGGRTSPRGTRASRALLRPSLLRGRRYAVSDDIVKRRAWYERNFLEGYKRAGRHDAKWDAQAEEFIRLSADLFLESAPNDPGDMVGRARTLVAAGCDDPVVLYLAALTLSSSDSESRHASELFERAYVGIPLSGYSRGTARFVATGLRRDLERRNEGMGRRHALDPVELRVLPRIASGRQLRPRRRPRSW